jgi:uncharacterized protein (DUF1778 family)
VIKKRRGRPPLPEHMKKPVIQPRTLARVTDSQWDVLKRAARESGKSFSEWAVPILMDAAVEQLKNTPPKAKR